MRPAYRTALIAALIFSTLLFGLAMWSLGEDRASRRGSHRLELITPPGGDLPLDAPEEEKLQSALERIEAAEIERFGEAEAARRKRIREQLVHERVNPAP